MQNSHYDCSRHAMKHKHYAFSMIVLMALSACPFCWCWWGTDCSIMIPKPFRVSMRSELINSPPLINSPSFDGGTMLDSCHCLKVINGFRCIWLLSEVGRPHVWGPIINKDNKVLEPVVGFNQKKLQVWMDKLKQPCGTRLWFWEWFGFHLGLGTAWANRDEPQGLNLREFLCAHWHFSECLWGHMSQLLVPNVVVSNMNGCNIHFGWHHSLGFNPIDCVRHLYR